MLRELHISNLAVISDVRVELAAGLNCFTGATGAGKSLIIGAVEVLLGLRSPAEMLRPGSDEGRVSGVFDVGDGESLQRIRSLTDLPVGDDGGELLLTRRLFASGRSSISLNGHPITLGMLKQVAEQLVDVHGQHDHQYLLKPSNQLDVIDQFGALLPLRRQYYDIYVRVTDIRRRVSELSASRALRKQQLELYRFQADEIDSAELDVAEYAELESRSSVLNNLERLKREAGAAHQAVYEVDGSVLERLKGVAAVLIDLSDLDASLKPVAQSMRDAAIAVEESAYDLSRYLDRLELDPAELTEVEDRLNTVHRVVSKYGDTVESALAYRAEIEQKLVELEKARDDDSGLQKQLAPLLTDLQRLAVDLSTRRAVVAAKLSPLIEKELSDLGMEKARFTVRLVAASVPVAADDANDAAAAGREAGGFSATRSALRRVETGELPPLPFTPTGQDAIEYIAQTNPGQLAQPLRKIASGGELSRIMLALKGILAQGDRVSVLVFDEIDSNVGGRLGSIIGSKLRRLAAHHQVLCITHLPQIASFADRHLTVQKGVADEKTQTVVRVMHGEERVRELAEMTGGQHVTSTTLAQARELLEAAQQASRPILPSMVPVKSAAKKRSSPADPVATGDLGPSDDLSPDSTAPTPTSQQSSPSKGRTRPVGPTVGDHPGSTRRPAGKDDGPAPADVDAAITRTRAKRPPSSRSPRN